MFNRWNLFAFGHFGLAYVMTAMALLILKKRTIFNDFHKLVSFAYFVAVLLIEKDKKWKEL